MLGKGLALSARRSMGLSHRAGLVLRYPDEKEGQQRSTWARILSARRR